MAAAAASASQNLSRNILGQNEMENCYRNFNWEKEIGRIRAEYEKMIRRRMTISDAAYVPKNVTERVFRELFKIRKEDPTQRHLNDVTQAYEAKEIIYALVIECIGQIYIGMTRNTVLERFKQHLQQAWARKSFDGKFAENKPINRNIRNVPFNKISVFPLEVVTAANCANLPAVEKKHWKPWHNYAAVREQYWIPLRSGAVPVGQQPHSKRVGLRRLQHAPA